ncbi:hypothetical protein NMY22_g4552 [Coprinellus aureogranulatus]|nr:hypothetical protein NMY22_g4552 [Coprinellus aureogranulatus]
MPEGPEAVSFEVKMNRMLKEEVRISKDPEPEGVLVLYPRCFAEGTSDKDYSTISVDTSQYNPSLEPDDPHYAAQCNPHDLASAKRNGCLYLVNRPLKAGTLVAAVRGKGLVVAAGYHAVTLNLGLEACCHVFRLEDYYAILDGDGPGPNPDRKKAQRLRSFRLPENLIDAGASQRSTAPSANIFCAFLTKHFAFVVTDFARLVRLHVTSRSTPWCADDLAVGSQAWNDTLWVFPDGPDWVLEAPLARVNLNRWRAQVLEKKTQQPIIQAITSNTTLAFGGFGRHLANDFLFHVAIHPGLSSYAVCRDAAMWNRLQNRIHPYMEQWRSKKFISQCVLQANSLNPLTFDEVSNRNYLTMFTKVYYKESVRMYLDLYNEYVQLGYFDPNHIIGKPYLADPAAISPIVPDVKGWHPVDVKMVQIGTTNLKAFTAICAQPPRKKAWRICDASEWDDIRTKGNATTLGPASFRELVRNRVQVDAPVLKRARGRPPKIRTNKPGRPRSTKHHLKHALLPKSLSAKKRLKENVMTAVAANVSLSPMKTRSGRKRSL